MASRSAAMEQAEAGDAPARPRRRGRGRAGPAARRRQRREAPAGGPWQRAWRAGLCAMLAGGLAAAAGLHFAGHAPSWRSLSVVALQSLPLLPGIALFWRGMESLRARHPSLPGPLWLGLVFLGTMAAMVVLPGLAFALHSSMSDLAARPESAVSLTRRLQDLGAALYIYGTTAFRLWWPWGAAVPAAVAALFWQAQRR